MVAAGVGQAWRSLRRNAGHSAVVVLILAVGIAITVAVYSVVAGVVLRPLPYAEPDRLVQIRQVDPRQGYVFGASGPSYRDWRESARAVEMLAVATSGGEATVKGGAEAFRVGVSSVGGEFFGLLGLPPVLGRGLDPDDAAEGRRAAVLSSDLWRRRFGGDAGVLGRVIEVEARPYEVVGVASEALRVPTGVDIWLPLAPDAGFMEVRHAHILEAFGRLARGATAASAQEELNGILAGVPDYGITALVIPLKEELMSEVRTPLLILFGAVVFVLLIACANVGTLMLARTEVRERELAVRRALGAGRGRVVVQLLSEGTVLALVAGAVGVLLSWWLIGVLVGLAPGDLPRAEEIGIDAGVLGFALATALLAGLLAGLIPALRLGRDAPYDGLRARDARGGMGARRLRSAFVIAEVSLSVVLLVGGGLLTRSFLRMIAVDPGFRPQNLATFEYSLPSSRYAEAWQMVRFQDDALEAVRGLPGVTGAATARNLPVGGTSMITPAVVEGIEHDNPPRVQIASVSDGYFEAMGVRVTGGRTFRRTDGADAPPVAIVDQAFVDAYFDGADPVGRRARTYFGEPVMREIVGVVESTAHASLTEPRQPKFYYPAAQMPWSAGHFVVRADMDPSALATAVRGALLRVDPEVPPGGMTSMGELLARTTAQPRFYAVTLGAFGLLALLLAVTGLFAVLSQSVAGRRREIGVRMAVGAVSTDIVRLVMREGMLLAATGLALGMAGGLAAGRLLGGLLFGVGTADPLVLGAVVGLLAAAALLATWVPSRRAAAVDPLVALRAD
ncbi:MAG TPA: ABC transporter permease [Longimicrobiales bacterium]|nr:ABC transporter permease [Longimicrobiales bacterium]